MELKIKKISSLEKVRNFNDKFDVAEDKISLFGGEHYAYQISIMSDGTTSNTKVSLTTDIPEYVTLYRVSDVLMDMPSHPNTKDDDYITKEAGPMPDLLIPFDMQKGQICPFTKHVTLWVDVNIPKDVPKGTHNINIKFNSVGTYNTEATAEVEDNTEIEIIPVNLPEHNIKYTQWFYVDCIASAHNVEIYSDKHWELIDKYMNLASKVGINTLLTPVLTPALDTEVGHFRPKTQLVGITFENDKYTFDFTLLNKWVDLCRKNGIENFEISHLFSQWGLKYTPCVYVNDELRFGWHTKGDNSDYKEFLKQFIPALISHLKSLGIDESNYFFHISDEPNESSVENYQTAYNIVKPLVGNAKILDAISNVEFYDLGLMDIPVCANNHITPFLEKDIENLWTYYCCVQYDDVSNRFMSMPSYRNRAIGLQLYKHNIKGFLHWGFNFYFSHRSLYAVNPYVTTSADISFPSGDAFSVYPYGDDVFPSLRSLVFKDALQDISFMKLAEKYIGKEKVVQLIEDIATTNISFTSYPKSNDFYKNFLNKMKLIIKQSL